MKNKQTMLICIGISLIFLIMFVGNAAANDGQYGIVIEKYTLGMDGVWYDADIAPGPAIPVGSTVEWKYEVTNYGYNPVLLDNVWDDQVDVDFYPVFLYPDSMYPDMPMEYFASGIAVPGQYENIGYVDAGDTIPSPSDPSHYYGIQPTVESSDGAGTIKDIFLEGEKVYAIGGGYVPSITYNLYVVEDVIWSNGDTIPSRVLGTATSVTTDDSGNILPTTIWSSAVVGGYDIIVDVNANGNYDEGIDALDDMDVNGAGYQAIPEFPTIALPVVAILGLAFIFQRRRN
ncbi:PEF-CTERM sorting domain-containing protein [Methanolobus sp. ZRKC3]|uniref:PEF-CTERM sorting domain-containing protein n=1 Tax=Methanolobus sp. ZRKC3 TaxID=3125786 RepID=UPI0032502C02